MRARHDYALIARIATEANARGARGNHVVAQYLGIPTRHAAALVSTARKQGHAIPYGRTGSNFGQPRPQLGRRHKDGCTPSPFTTRPKILACDDCDFTCPTDRGPALRTHVHDVHGRWPTRDERTPVLRGAAA